MASIVKNMDIMDIMDIMDRDRIRGTGTKSGYFSQGAKQPLFSEKTDGESGGKFVLYFILNIKQSPLSFLFDL